MDQEIEDPLLGTAIGDRFRLDELLGAGGMGRVYIAEQLSMERSVAVKVLQSEIVNSKESRQRFFREAKLLSSLTHPNIVRVIEFGRDRQRDILYLVMELVKGVPISRLNNAGPVQPEFALDVIYQVCGALAEAHGKGIVHRDLKPENLLLVGVADETLQVKVVDFGVAFPQHESMKLTKSGAICGTPMYMAPEQAESGEVQPQSDLYALGIVLYEMLSGQLPFEGDTPISVMIQHVQAQPPPLRSHLAEVGAAEVEICELVDDLLAKDPADRPESALDVRRRIEAIRRQYDLHPPRLSSLEGRVDRQILLATGESSDTEVSPFQPTALGIIAHDSDTIHDSPPELIDAESEAPATPSNEPENTTDGRSDSSLAPIQPMHLGVSAAVGVLVAIGLVVLFGFPGGDEAVGDAEAVPVQQVVEIEETAPAPDDADDRQARAESVRLGLLYIDGDDEADEVANALIRELTFGLSGQPHIEWMDRSGILDLFSQEGIEDSSDLERIDELACSVGRRGGLDHVLVGELDLNDERWRLRSRFTSTETRAVTGTFEIFGDSTEELSEGLIAEISAWAQEI